MGLDVAYVCWCSSFFFPFFSLVCLFGAMVCSSSWFCFLSVAVSWFEAGCRLHTLWYAVFHDVTCVL